MRFELLRNIKGRNFRQYKRNWYQTYS